MVFQQNNISTGGREKFFIGSIVLILLFYGASVGINLTGFALFLHQSGMSKLQIGNILAMELAGNLMIAPIFPRLSEKYGIFKIILFSLIVRNLCLLMFASSTSIMAHMLWLFGFGLSGFCLFAAVQYWGTTLLEESKRSTVLGIMNVAFGAGIASGVAFLLFKASNISFELFCISSLFSTVILFPAIMAKASIPSSQTKICYSAPTKIINHVLLPILCGLSASYILLAITNFVVIYAMENGVEYYEAIKINIYMVVGNIFLTIPIGMVIDKFKNKSNLLIILVAVIAIALLFIPASLASAKMMATVFIIISGATGGVYVLGLSAISAKFRSNDLATANTVMLMMNAIGGFAGVSATGVAIEYWGSNGFIISVFSIMLCFLLFTLYNRKFGSSL